ncbi:hypothetical protein LV457_18175 [Mycobacterium sp. MYCO198283]|uniref:hypothetical protein n=1 Tax=Mycobacterium sp. MYCO198283 TaxID=2883505 RepID=UPI001E3E69D8|nr:hypothetical protein [Mycobacterium sp. MYCO198283]MCG5434202.1 hypothetical protein [Mycobacterium sp. MYCO198283]
MLTLEPGELPSAGQLAELLDRDGVVCLTGAVPDEWLAAARSSVLDSIGARGGNGFVAFGGGDGAAFAESPGVRIEPSVWRLLSDVAAQRLPRSGRLRPLPPCLRVLAGPLPQEKPLLLHYDASIVTIVVPIIIPEGERGRHGELMLFPNQRPFRQSLTVHIADKLRAQNGWTRRRAVERALADPDRYVVDLEPGNAYLFWGYRTFHGNLRCAPNLTRATLIVQFGEPHPAGPLPALLRLQREWRRSRCMRAANAAGQRPRRVESVT